MWFLGSLLARTFASHCLGHKPKAKVTTIWVKTHEMPSVGGSTIYLMLGKNWEKECMKGCGMLCVMCVLDKFEPKEATNLMNFPKCVKWVLDEFSDVMPEELPNELPPIRQVDHAMKVMSEVAAPTKTHIEWTMRSWRNLRFNLRNSLWKVTLNLTSHHMGHPSSLFIRRMGHWDVCGL